MMANTSATGGQLTATTRNLTGQALRRMLQQIVARCTELDGALVRQAYQQSPAPEPAHGTTWGYLHLASWVPDANPYMHQETDKASLVRYETADLQVSFYGPDADECCGMLRDALMVDQNRDELVANRIGVVRVGQTLRVPEPVYPDWVNRCDIIVTLSRQVVREYKVLTITGVQGTIYANGPCPALTTSFRVVQ